MNQIIYERKVLGSFFLLRAISESDLSSRTHLRHFITFFLLFWQYLSGDKYKRK